MARVSLKTLLDRSDRNMNSGTHPVVRKSALKVIEIAYAEGINAQISEGNRTASRQNQLYRQGRTTPGNIVTNARAGQSWHNYGVAIDYFLTSEDGQKAIWTVNNKWRRVADIAHSLGFEWGGVWTSFVDYPHLQMTGGLSLSDLRAGKKPKLNMKDGSSVPKPSKPIKTPSVSDNGYRSVDGNWTGQTLVNGVKGKPVTQLQTKLVANYFYPDKGAKNNGIDEHYGGDTEDAVRRYQIVKGLTVDGKAGKEVYRSLDGKIPSKKPVSKPKPTKSKGDPVVIMIQNKVNRYHGISIDVDGLPGPDTYKSVVNAYQQELRVQFGANIVADGFPGPKTDRAAITIRENNSFGDIAWLTQAMLYLHGIDIVIDGFFGSDSVKATKKFQKNKGLKPEDGTPGKDTFKKLIRF